MYTAWREVCNSNPRLLKDPQVRLHLSPDLLKWFKADSPQLCHTHYSQNLPIVEDAMLTGYTAKVCIGVPHDLIPCHDCGHPAAPDSSCGHCEEATCENCLVNAPDFWEGGQVCAICSKLLIYHSSYTPR
jgi:hypothetical protein